MNQLAQIFGTKFRALAQAVKPFPTGILLEGTSICGRRRAPLHINFIIRCIVPSGWMNHLLQESLESSLAPRAGTSVGLANIPWHTRLAEANPSGHRSSWPPEEPHWRDGTPGSRRQRCRGEWHPCSSCMC